MSVGAPKENTNALKYTLEYAIDIFNKAIELSKKKSDYVVSGQKIKGYEYHFIGEVATSEELDTYTDVFLYLKNSFKECEELYNKLKNRLEANCFSDSKKGIIKEATAIMNLKSNYNWTDRQQTDVTTNGKELNTAPIIQFIDTEDGDKIQ